MFHGRPGMVQEVEYSEFDYFGGTSAPFQPASHGGVMGYYQVGVRQPPDFLLFRQRLAAETAQVMDQRHHFGPAGVCHAAHRRKIFLKRILKHNDVARTDGAAFLDHTGQIADKMFETTARHRLLDAEVAVAQTAHHGLDVGTGLVAGAQRPFVVACQITVHLLRFFANLLIIRFSVPFRH